MKSKRNYLITTVFCSLFSIFLIHRSASADMIGEAGIYYSSEKLSPAAQIAIILILAGLAILAVIGIVLIHKHKKEEEKMQEERRKAEKEEEERF